MRQNTWAKRFERLWRYFLLNSFPKRFGETSGQHPIQINGVKLWLDFSEAMHRRIYVGGMYEPELTQILMSSLRPNDVFFDIGANFGWYTVNSLVRCPFIASVYAFEPQADTVALVRKSLEANGVANRATVKQIGLGSKIETSKIKKFTNFGTMQSSLYDLADWNYTEEPIEISTLDTEVQKANVIPNVIKCDVEGFELEVLKGAQNLLSNMHNNPPLWFIEANYETSAMAGYFPWHLIEYAQEQNSAMKPFAIRNGLVQPLPHHKALRHGDTLILAIPDIHLSRFERK